MAVTIDDGEYTKGVEDNQFSVIGRLQMQKGSNWSNLGFKEKLALFGIFRDSKLRQLEKTTSTPDCTQWRIKVKS